MTTTSFVLGRVSERNILQNSCYKMNNIKTFEIQQQVKNESDETISLLSDLYKWEKEMKKMEENNKSAAENKEQVVNNIRSHVFEESTAKMKEDMEKRNKDDTQKEKKLTEANTMSRKEADEWKEKGNGYIKLEQYKEAVYAYTEAIMRYEHDANYFANRALAFLKLEKYNQCIDDCEQALKLDPSKAKAYYRMMQAYESLGEVDKAFFNCKKVLDLEPKDVLAKRSLDRLSSRLSKEEKKRQKKASSDGGQEKPKEKIKWSMTDGDKEIKPCIKPPHLQSKAPLKKIEVVDGSIEVVPPKSGVQKVAKAEKEAKNLTNTTKILKDNSTVFGTVLAGPKMEKPSQNKTDKSSQSKIKNLVPPTSSMQFYSNWRELTKEEKFKYFKDIAFKDINKILGASLNSEVLSEILEVMDEYYITNECNVLDALKELSKHDQMNILSAFLSESDRQALKRLVSYAVDKGGSVTDVNKIKSTFFLGD